MRPAAQPVDDAVFRPVAAALAKPLAPTALRPNHVTAAHLAVGLLGAGALAAGHPAAAAVLLLACQILDRLDGQLARLQGTGSALGDALDNVVDHLVRIATFAAVGLHLRADGAVWGVVALALAGNAWLAALCDAEVWRPDSASAHGGRDAGAIVGVYRFVAGALWALTPGLRERAAGKAAPPRGARSLALWAGSGTQIVIFGAFCLVDRLWWYVVATAVLAPAYAGVAIGAEWLDQRRAGIRGAR